MLNSWRLIDSQPIHEKYFSDVCHTSNATAQRNRFSTMPTCQSCITEVAEVTDNDGASTQQIKTLKNISSGILIALFSIAENKLKSRLVTGQWRIEWRIIRYSFVIYSNAQSLSQARSVPLTPRFTTTQSAISLPR